MYLAPQNIPRAISVLTLGNDVVLYIDLASPLLVISLTGSSPVCVCVGVRACVCVCVCVCLCVCV